MIRFDMLEEQVDSYKAQFYSAKPFEHIVIDGFCDDSKLKEACRNLTAPVSGVDKKSGDFVFAKNKFEKSQFNEVCPEFDILKQELMSDRFAQWVSKVTGENIFIDPDFHGGGLHQGGVGSFLDMHADFNFHPNKRTWFRNVNILLYLNEAWEPSFGGELTLKDGRIPDGESFQIAPIFNRAVIMFTREYTLHGYSEINFPEGSYRRSIAAYGYTEMEKEGDVRTTVWYPERGGIAKKMLARYMPKLIRIKSAIFGSKAKKHK
ncbi:2OG-Fe(II) oxygenase [Saccharophagus degradans]|uniref:2OG-Fe(II) oxygenase n=1 Tax=Saccharophagus degradans TaxID=86304 RepID=UPI002477F6EB|nr:2OG-Fe(II) oxygenase [Saccharophagus degradans]WGP00382.1 2OG-Fe(II) oxygenase [Saccharophagus degradans]